MSKYTQLHMQRKLYQHILHQQKLSLIHAQKEKHPAISARAEPKRTKKVITILKPMWNQGIISAFQISRYHDKTQSSPILHPSIFLISHCCRIDRILLHVQYNNKPDGKEENIKRNTTGRACITLAWTGSAG